MDNSVLKDEFIKSLNSLVGELCWGFVPKQYSVDEYTQFVVSLHFGRKLPRAVALPDANLSRDVQKYEGSLELLIQCAWRLDSTSEVIYSCQSTLSENIEEDEMLHALASIRNQKVTRVLVKEPSFDFEVEFDHGLCLRVFCDQVNLYDMDNNYTLYVENISYTVGTKSTLKKDT